MVRRQLADVAQRLRQAADRRGFDQAAPARWAAIQRVLDVDHPAPVGDDHSGPVDAISATFGLDLLARDILAISSAADLDPTVAAAYAALEGRSESGPPSLGLALELAGCPLLSPAARAVVAPTAPLCRFGLVDLTPGPLLLGRRLVVAQGVVDALLGSPSSDPTIDAMTAEAADFGATPADGRAVAMLRAGYRFLWIEQLPGGDGVEVAVRALAELGTPALICDLTLRPAGIDPVEATRAAVRSAALRGRALVLSGVGQLGDRDGCQAARLWHGAPIPVVVVGDTPWPAVWHHDLPPMVAAPPWTADRRLTRWRHHLPGNDIPDSTLLQYRLTPAQIDAAGRHAVRTAALAGASPGTAQITESVRLLGSSSGRRRDRAPALSFADIQLPPEANATLRRFADWVRVREVVGRSEVATYGGRAGGIAALFSGNPGTGKTLAARLVADVAGLDLLQVDLSTVIDKYIGETEKNLERVFVQAESLNVVLFFDEADALFGTRSAIRDARDRYANQEVTYLLQRIEEFDGVAVLATNLRGNLDPAFARRMHFAIHFPDPDAPTRRRLWTGLLDRAESMDPDDPVDVGALATTAELCGGDLRNIVVAAVYDATVAGVPLGYRHIRAATVREYGKLGRRVPPELRDSNVASTPENGWSPAHA